MPTDYQQLIAEFVRREDLPPSYGEDAARYIVPLLPRLEAMAAAGNGARVIGINGTQGSGKSTLAALLETLLNAQSLHTVRLSIDDFYLSRATRAELARDIHPLLASRGVPGTHDMHLAIGTLTRLIDATGDDAVSLPRFDKASDDCVPPAEWPVARGPFAFVILEGWCIGCPPQAPAELVAPINALEAEEDPDGVWRAYVNTRLGGDYQDLFKLIELLIVLQAPGFDSVLAWRILQEAKLRQRSGDGASALMSEADIARFIQHFERLTRHGLKTLPQRAQVLLELDVDHRIVACRDGLT